MARRRPGRSKSAKSARERIKKALRKAAQEAFDDPYLINLALRWAPDRPHETASQWKIRAFLKKRGLGPQLPRGLSKQRTREVGRKRGRDGKIRGRRIVRLATLEREDE